MAGQIATLGYLYSLMNSTVPMGADTKRLVTGKRVTDFGGLGVNSPYGYNSRLVSKNGIYKKTVTPTVEQYTLNIYIHCEIATYITVTYADSNSASNSKNWYVSGNYTAPSISVNKDSMVKITSESGTITYNMGSGIRNAQYSGNNIMFNVITNGAAIQLVIR